MNVMVVGNGGREHALVWKLSQSRRADKIFAAPGNGGTTALATNLPISDSDIPALIAAAREHAIDLTIVGPEAPLAAGLVDAFNEAGLKAFGPTAAAARIESSKVWSKDLMAKYGIPTADYKRVDNADEAFAYLSSRANGPVAVKADGLAAGKGVIMAADHVEAMQAAISMFEGQFGDAGSSVVLEEVLIGPEVSIFAFVDGAHVSTEVSACDYKRIGDGDTGLNTGGMGAYTPPEFWDDELATTVRTTIMERAAAAMVAEGCPFTGILYGGVMVTAQGPKVIEFNCRLGDPDGALVLPRLESDLLETCLAAAEGRLDHHDVSWSDKSYVSVVMASGGYPEKYETGKLIEGVDSANNVALVFHAGTKPTDDGTVTAGGRVLAVAAGGSNISEARASAYKAVEKISFEGAVYRTDIAKRAEK